MTCCVKLKLATEVRVHSLKEIDQTLLKKHKNVSFGTLYINNIDNTPLTLRAVNKGW